MMQNAPSGREKEIERAHISEEVDKEPVKENPEGEKSQHLCWKIDKPQKKRLKREWMKKQKNSPTSGASPTNYQPKHSKRKIRRFKGRGRHTRREGRGKIAQEN